jgi:hypothetical protein
MERRVYDLKAAIKTLLSTGSKVMDIITAGDVHHIFPKDYLKKNNMDEKSLYNQVANYVHLDTSVDIAISNNANLWQRR